MGNDCSINYFLIRLIFVLEHNRLHLLNFLFQKMDFILTDPPQPIVETVFFSSENTWYDQVKSGMAEHVRK